MKPIRPIRFKAKDIKTGEWVDGYYTTHHFANYDERGEVKGFSERHCIFNDDPGNRKGGYWTYINPATLCQFTGMKDNDGSNIWENDIVYDTMMTAGCYMRVFWYEKYGCFKCYHPVHGIIPVQSDSIEKVGNIFDDVEVLDSEYEPHEVRWMLEMKEL